MSQGIMMSTVGSFGYALPISSLSSDTRDALISELTLTPINLDSSLGLVASSPRQIPLYQHGVVGSEAALIVPKYFGLLRFGAPGTMAYTDVASDDTSFPVFTGVMRPPQTRVTDQFLVQARDPLIGGGIITLQCGGGKTVVALSISAELRRKTLIVVHKEFLLTQWRERIAQFIPDASVGLIKAGVVDVEGRHIVLASLQSLSMKTYPPAVFDGFGTLIVDECHRVGTEVFSRALFKTAFRYTLGLSATLERKDGMTCAIVNHLGPPIVVDNTVTVDARLQDPLVVRVQIVKFSSNNTAYAAQEIVHRRMDSGAVKPYPNLSRMINNICAFVPRVNFVAGIISALLEREPHRRILVLSDRKSHLQMLRDNLVLADTDADVGFYWGGMKPDELRASAKCRVICATYPYAAEGMDIPALDTLVLASPKTDVVQSCGRITRGGNGRNYPPLVIDVVDTFSGIFQAQARKRLNFYRKSGMLVESSN